jgi:DNA recombination protein RmuC
MTPIDITILVLLSLVLVACIAIWSRLPNGDQTASTERLHAIIGETTRLQEERLRTLEQALQNVEQRVASELANVREMLAQRIGEQLNSQTENSAVLREHLGTRLDASSRYIATQLADARTQTQRSLSDLQVQTTSSLARHQTQFEQRQSEALKALQDSVRANAESLQKQVGGYLEQSREHLGERVSTLTKNTNERLREISGQVEKRLADGFDKTTATFTDIVKRLALIDDAQKKITELSGNVVSLQEVLADKRSRGAFGEVQLNALVRNVLPESSFAIQHTLSNDRIADCMLFLPHPTGHVAIDSKFPLESYQRMTTPGLGEADRAAAERSFKVDIRKHIKDISQRYIVPGETADGAVMFLPAEAVFAEIQAYHPDLVQTAHDARVWIASPTTLMAILNTARAVIKDEATRQQVNIIQQHLGTLAKDFDRFQQRMDNLAKHIKQAGEDVDQVHISARKIASRFDKIERVDLREEATSSTTKTEAPSTLERD